MNLLTQPPTIHAIHRLTPTIVEVVVHAPLAALNFRPGQFFRLHNYETLAPQIKDTSLTMEGLALTGAWADPAQGLLGLIVLEMGGSSSFCAFLKQGEPVVLMGPTGLPTDIRPKETVCLVGGGLGNAVLFSIGQAARAKRCHVVYFAGYKKIQDRYKPQDIESAADIVVWCCDESPGFSPSRPQDQTFIGTIVEAMECYATQNFQDIALPDVDRMIVIGSDRMMAAVAAARHSRLAPYLKKQHIAVGSINSPMQCMMKGICAQCLQRHVHPVTGEESVIFSCAHQDQFLDYVDWACLRDRLSQNTLSEKLTSLWVTEVLNELT